MALIALTSLLARPPLVASPPKATRRSSRVSTSTKAKAKDGPCVPGCDGGSEVEESADEYKPNKKKQKKNGDGKEERVKREKTKASAAAAPPPAPVKPPLPSLSPPGVVAGAEFVLTSNDPSTPLELRRLADSVLRHLSSINPRFSLMSTSISHRKSLPRTPEESSLQSQLLSRALLWMGHSATTQFAPSVAPMDRFLSLLNLTTTLPPLATSAEKKAIADQAFRLFSTPISDFDDTSRHQILTVLNLPLLTPSPPTPDTEALFESLRGSSDPTADMAAWLATVLHPNGNLDELSLVLMGALIEGTIIWRRDGAIHVDALALAANRGILRGPTLEKCLDLGLRRVKQAERRKAVQELAESGKDVEMGVPVESMGGGEENQVDMIVE